MPSARSIAVTRGMVNLREGWRGHLWQGRFASFVLDEPYLLTAARYVELNPVRAGLVNAPRQYRWSSAAAHVRGKDDKLVRVAPLLKLAPNWRAFLARVIREEDIKLLRAARAYWTAAWRRRFSGNARRRPGQNPKTAETWPEANAAALENVSPESAESD